MISSPIRLFLLAATAALLLGWFAKYTIDQRRIGANEIIEDTREKIDEINQIAIDGDARFIACFDGGFLYDHAKGRCTQIRFDR